MKTKRKKPYQTSRGKRLKADPLRIFLEKHMSLYDLEVEQLSKKMGIELTIVKDILRSKNKTVFESTVDHILMELGETYMFNEIYPLEDE